jgi:glycosyltransferase involved in cell wall biosynthesis
MVPHNRHKHEPHHLAIVTHNPIRTGGMQKFSRFITQTVLSAGWRVTVFLSGENIYADLQTRFPQQLTIEHAEWLDQHAAGDRECHLKRIYNRYARFRRSRPDAALFIQSSNTPFRASVIGARLADVPTVITHRTMPWIKDFVPVGRHVFNLLPGLGLHNRKMIRRTRRVARWTDRIVYNSNHVRRSYEQTFNYPQDKGCVIHNALDMNLLRHPVTNQIAQGQANTVTIGYAGRLGAEKQLDMLLQAVAALPNHASFRLLIFGEGPERENLARLGDQLGLTDKLEWRNPTDNIYDIYRHMDIACLPSRRESSSNMIVEAMAAGKPVIVSNVGGLPELVDHGSAGLIVPSADPEQLSLAIAALLDNPQQRITLGHKARRHVLRMHDPSLISRCWLALLNELVENKTAAATDETERNDCPWKAPFFERDLDPISNS